MSGETATFDPSTEDVDGKTLVYANAVRREIVQVIGTGTGYVEIEVVGAIVSSAPSKIVDTNTAGYYISIGISSDASYKTIFTLDSDFVDAPVFKTKLDLGETYNIKIKSFNDTGESSYSDLIAGSYDPDHKEGGQTDQSYTVPYAMTLPDITDDGAISVATTANGVLISISSG